MAVIRDKQYFRVAIKHLQMIQACYWWAAAGSLFLIIICLRFERMGADIYNYLNDK